MAQLTINIGAAPNDGTGDSLRQGGAKINANFTELYTEINSLATVATTGDYNDLINTPGAGGGGGGATFGGTAVTDVAAGTNVTFADDGDGTITINVSGAIATLADGNYGDVTVSGSGATIEVNAGVLDTSHIVSSARTGTDLDFVTGTAGSDGNLAVWNAGDLVDGPDILDEDNMASNSATDLATQQSIKAYVDNSLAAQTHTLSEITDAGTAAALDVGTSASNVVQLDGSGRLPAVDGSQLTGINFDISGTPTAGQFATWVDADTIAGTSILDEDDMTSNSATNVASQQSIKAYVDTSISGFASLGDLVSTDSGNPLTHGTDDKVLLPATTAGAGVQAIKEALDNTSNRLVPTIVDLANASAWTEVSLTGGSSDEITVLSSNGWNQWCNVSTTAAVVQNTWPDAVATGDGTPIRLRVIIASGGSVTFEATTPTTVVQEGDAGATLNTVGKYDIWLGVDEAGNPERFSRLVVDSS